MNQFPPGHNLRRLINVIGVNDTIDKFIASVTNLKNTL
jgi:hypothetical protein